jgi:hypothetical protein
MNSRILLLIIFCLLIFFPGSAQEISFQQTNPTSLKWFQVNTPNFNVLFPKGFDQQALRVANTLELIHDPEASSMGVRPKPISIILQSQSSISNAFVTLAPRRSEFYIMPPQNYNFAGTNDWLSLLASHEYRHVVQYQRSIVGFNKFVYYIFGQQALSLTAFAAAPQWFWEGDAVATETAFTRSGRGRIPNFALLFRTNLLEGRTFNYHKQYLRSYKNNIPDHYVLGYHMITYLRNKTNDPDIWEKVVKRSWSAPYIPFGFSRSIRKESGMNVMALYRSMADSLRNGWQKEVDALQLTKFTTMNKRKSKTYTDYEYPQPLEDGSVIALKSGLGNISTIVKIKDGVEKKLFVTGPMNDAGMLSVAHDRIVWNEYRYDPRWQVKNYSVVKAYNTILNKSKDLSKHSRYGAAALSPDGTKVVTVESTTDYKLGLVVLDYSTGGVLKRFDNPNNNLPAMPRWSPDGQSIIATQLSKEGKKISLYDYETGAVKDLMDAGNENVGAPVISPDGKYVLYNSPYSGIDNIYALEITTGRRLQVSTSKYGAYNPAISPDGQAIYYNDQTRDGFDIVRAPFEPASWKDINDVKQPGQHFYDKLVSQEQHADIMKDVPEKQYPVTKFSKFRSLINVHSWGPFFGSDYTQADIGISSRNLLGTMVVNAGYLFDINERTGSYHAGFSYQGLYPVIDFNVLAGKRETNTRAFDRNVKFTWNETTYTAGLRLPLLLTRSKYNTNVTLKNWVGATQVSGFRNQVTKNNRLLSEGNSRIVRVADTLQYIYDNQVGNGTLIYNQATLSFQRFMRQSRRDFNPKFAQLIDVELYSTPYGGDFRGQLFATRGSFYFPGFAKHHSVVLRAGYQKEMSGVGDVSLYTFRNRIARPRGFTYPFDSEFRAVSVNYALPIWYPDISLGPLVNIQRLRANAFFDFGQGLGTNWFYGDSGWAHGVRTDNYYRSVGAEFTVDVNVMRLLPQLDLGLRTTYINPTSSSDRRLVVEFVLGTLNF